MYEVKLGFGPFAKTLRLEDDERPCPRCHGWRDILARYGRYNIGTAKCPDCNGSGKVKSLWPARAEAKS